MAAVLTCILTRAQALFYLCYLHTRLLEMPQLAVGVQQSCTHYSEAINFGLGVTPNSTWELLLVCV